MTLDLLSLLLELDAYFPTEEGSWADVPLTCMLPTSAGKCNLERNCNGRADGLARDRILRDSQKRGRLVSSQKLGHPVMSSGKKSVG